MKPLQLQGWTLDLSVFLRGCLELWWRREGKLFRRRSRRRCLEKSRTCEWSMVPFHLAYMNDPYLWCQCTRIINLSNFISDGSPLARDLIQFFEFRHYSFSGISGVGCCQTMLPMSKEACPCVLSYVVFRCSWDFSELL